MLASAWVLADGGQRNAIVVPVLPQALQVQIIDNNDDCGCENSQKKEAIYCDVEIRNDQGQIIATGTCFLCNCDRLAEKLVARYTASVQSVQSGE